MLIICLVEGFGGTLCPDIDPIMMICPSSILLETMESTLSWVHRQRADVMFRVSSTTNYDIPTEYIDIQHSSPRLHGAIPECLRGAKTRIVDANIDLIYILFKFFFRDNRQSLLTVPFQVQDGN